MKLLVVVVCCRIKILMLAMFLCELQERRWPRPVPLRLCRAVIHGHAPLELQWAPPAHQDSEEDQGHPDEIHVASIQICWLLKQNRNLPCTWSFRWGSYLHCQACKARYPVNQKLLNELVHNLSVFSYIPGCARLIMTVHDLSYRRKCWSLTNLIKAIIYIRIADRLFCCGQELLISH